MEKLIKFVVGKPIKIVAEPKGEIVDLGDVPDDACDPVEAREIKVCLSVVIKKLLHDNEFAVERLGNARLVGQG